jgi:hypothetical protein
MKKEGQIWLALAVLFVGAVILVSSLSVSDNKPFSSYSAEPDGAKASYLLLQELGFKVQRNTQKNWNGQGALIALGSDYLSDTSQAIILPQEYRFKNEFIGENAADFIEQLWPYFDSVIVFQEYGRSAYHSNSAARAEMTLWSILPEWAHVILLGAGLIAFFLMFFYGQRLGAPVEAAGFFGRAPLESVYAMGAALQKSSVYQDCAGYYYRYRARQGAPWDDEGHLAAKLARLPNEEAARKLMADIDQKIKEYRNEGK